MPNKLLVAIDKLLWKIDRAAKTCKSINGKVFGAFTFFIACCTIVSFLGTDALKNIPIIKSAYYDTVVTNFPRFVEFLSAPVGKLLFAVLSVFITCCYFFRKLHRPCALLVAHSTMGHDLSALEESLKKSFWFRRANVGSQLPSQNATEEQVVSAIQNQDRTSEKMRAKNWCSVVFYYGVAHTPLIFRLGYQWGQTKAVRLLHRFRPTLDAQEFKELPEVDSDKLAFLSRIMTNRSESKELLVAISTTYPIIEENIGLIDPADDMYHYWIQVKEEYRGVDFFNSYHKIRSYGDSFVADIEKIVRSKNIQTVHVILSSSVPFTFYLAQRMSSNQFNRIIVYHYDHTKFTWGIDISEPIAEKAVTWARGGITITTEENT